MPLRFEEGAEGGWNGRWEEEDKERVSEQRCGEGGHLSECAHSETVWCPLLFLDMGDVWVRWCWMVWVGSLDRDGDSPTRGIAALLFRGGGEREEREEKGGGRQTEGKRDGEK